jgi:hypothetical protein
MLDKVAKAIYEIAHPVADLPERYRWDNMEPLYKRTWLEAARAALQALREPTPEMLDAAEATIFEYAPRSEQWQLDATKRGWQAMIDKAFEG